MTATAWSPSPFAEIIVPPCPNCEVPPGAEGSPARLAWLVTRPFEVAHPPWHVWVGVNGKFYASRYVSAEPPQTWTWGPAADLSELRQAITCGCPPWAWRRARNAEARQYLLGRGFPVPLAR